MKEWCKSFKGWNTKEALEYVKESLDYLKESKDKWWPVAHAYAILVNLHFLAEIEQMFQEESKDEY
jgi:hypothetical protein